MIHPQWVKYFQAGQARCSSPLWHTLYPANDNRNLKYGWSNLFGSIPKKVNCINYYSTGDEVLRNFNPAVSSFPDNLLSLGRDGIWYAGEINKGRWFVGSLVLASHGGWGWSRNSRIIDEEPPYGHVRWHRITPQEVSLLNNVTLATQPIFKNMRDTSIYPNTENGEVRSEIPDTRAYAMSESIPVLGQAMGSNPSNVMNGFNMNAVMEDGWPYRPPKGLIATYDWRHSDVLYVASVYLHPLIQNIISSGGLR